MLCAGAAAAGALTLALHADGVDDAVHRLVHQDARDQPDAENRCQSPQHLQRMVSSLKAASLVLRSGRAVA